MAPRKQNDPIAGRRRLDDEGEDEQPPIEDDDSSIGSAASDGEHEADVDEDGSELDSSPIAKRKSTQGTTNENGSPEKDTVESNAPAGDLATQSADTIAMMNGLQIKDDEAGEAIQFGDNPQEDITEPDKNETAVERRKREHEEYKKKRDADPAFVPNRGGFFMHDSRNSFPESNSFRGGRGRGRGGRGGMSFVPFPQAGVASAPWAHDLHETVTEDEPSKDPPTVQTPVAQQQPQPQPSNPVIQPMSNPPPNRTFSRTLHIGNVNLRVLLPGMTQPITFSAVPINLHTRLPHHRPPLRRDKPVRISMPDHSPRYIFPATDRSFIFIPRAMRPNQQGFGTRSRGRGSFTGYPNFSARNSIFGGSIYTPSIAHSRRSSFARDIAREGMPSPAGSIASRNRSILDPNKPIVRLPSVGPYGNQYPPQMQYGATSPVVHLPQTIPQRPTMQTHAGPIPMHQPRPQKQITVADIESPANFPPPQVQQQQPFHHQVPANLNGQGYESHSRRTSHPSQHGTPLSQIPERAVQAQAFQPAFPYPPQQAFYPQQYATPMYYYAPAGQAMAAAAPPFIPGQQYPFMVPATTMPPPEATSQSGTVAHESNGMVYYYDSSQLAATTTTEDPALYQQMAFVPPTGYVMAAPQGTVYYASQ